MGIQGSGNVVSASRISGDALVVSVNGDVDLSRSPEMRRSLLALLNEHRPQRLVLNLENVPYMDSSALAVLVELMRKMGRSGKVILAGLQPRVRGLMEIARLDTIFPLAADEQEAMSR
jgi:anti-sigma B factor antagonist